MRISGHLIASPHPKPLPTEWRGASKGLNGKSILAKLQNAYEKGFWGGRSVLRPCEGGRDETGYSSNHAVLTAS